MRDVREVAVLMLRSELFSPHHAFGLYGPNRWGVRAAKHLLVIAHTNSTAVATGTLFAGSRNRRQLSDTLDNFPKGRCEHLVSSLGLQRFGDVPERRGCVRTSGGTMLQYRSTLHANPTLWIGSTVGIRFALPTCNAARACSCALVESALSDPSSSATSLAA